VEYELTERGRTLASVFDAMAAWGEADKARPSDADQPRR
jgi:DNA-binding HxlR family transcriptional regulator